jgi:outer membrane autotransporter protein
MMEGETFIAVRHSKIKKKVLAMQICSALALAFAPQVWGTAAAAEVGESVTVEAGQTKETTADSTGQIGYTTIYNDVTIGTGGRWRPMDAIIVPYEFTGSEICINKLDTESGGMVDLTWQETPNPAVLSWGDSVFRNLYITNAALADGTVFRIGARTAEWANGNPSGVANNAIIMGDTSHPVAGGGTLYVQFGNIIGFDPTKINNDNRTFGLSPSIGTGRVLEIYQTKLGQFKIAGQASYLDAPLHVYKVLPVIGFEEDKNYYNLLTGYLKDYIIDNTGLLSESAKTAGDMQLSMRNLWRVENANALQHLDGLHRPGTKDQEGIWTNTYGGQFTNRSSYGRSLKENYHGLQVGYDKGRAGSFYDGSLYTGLFFQQAKADTGLSAGSGNSESKGFGTYATWVGQNGRFVDLMVRASKLNSDYSFNNNGGKVAGNNSTWAFGVNTRYGIHKPLANGWFWEPQAGMALGQINDAGYTTSNGLQVEQSRVKVLTGQLGVLVGRSLGERNGSLYAKATVNHDFLDGGSMVGRYSDGTQAIETGSNRDTWCELALGGKTKISPTGNFNLNVLRTFGGDVKTIWQVNGGLDWRWNGFGAGKKVQEKSNSPEEAIPVPSSYKETVNDRQATPVAAVGDAVLQGAVPDRQENIANRVQTAAPGIRSEEAVPRIPRQEEPQPAGKDIAAKPASSSPVSGQTADHDAYPSYELEPVVVEAPRPAWEDKLSPGTVTIIEPDKYKGEQKTLPDLLKEVPGVHVRYSAGGIGQYTTVSVRGSTASQVGVFVDGVLTNLGGDAAVDISTIPIQNVARIEVYRGYVPARFGGTYMGGVINIVTKKPEKANVSASYGQRSWGGYTGSLQIDTPLGNGSLMVGINRDQSEGDFRYTNFGYKAGIGRTLTHYEDLIASYEKSIAQGDLPPDFPSYLDAKKDLAYFKGLKAERHRMNNRYKNTDAILKWQDEHWLAKASWKQIDRVMPNALTGDWSYKDVPDADTLHDLTQRTISSYNPRRNQKLTARDLLIGRRDTSGNLEWGWNINYLDQDKAYRNHGLSTNADLRPLSRWSAYNSNKYGGSLDGSFKAGNHMLEFLTNFSQETMKIDGWKMNEITADWSQQWKTKYKQTLFNAQLQDTITLNEAGDLWFTPNIRYNSSDVVGTSRYQDAWHHWTTPDEGQKDSKTTWQLALKKKVNDGLTLRSSYGSYFRLLNLYEIAGDGASILPRPKNTAWGGTTSTYPRPEEGMQWDAGAAWKGRWLKADADVALTYFNRRSSNLLQLYRYGFDYWCYSNAARGKASGVELQSNLTWDKWDFNLSATYTDTKRTVKDTSPTGFDTWSRTFPMTYTPEWEGKLRLTYRPDNKTALFTEINYTDEQFFQDQLSGENQYIQSALMTVGLGIRYKLDHNSRLVFGVNDLFDKGPEIKCRTYSNGTVTESNADYPLQGRTFYTTWQYDF